MYQLDSLLEESDNSLGGEVMLLRLDENDLDVESIDEDFSSGSVGMESMEAMQGL